MVNMFKDTNDRKFKKINTPRNVDPVRASRSTRKYSQKSRRSLARILGAKLKARKLP